MQQYNTKQEQMRFYKSKAWRSLRAEVLKEQNYECQECKRLGLVTLTDSDKHKTLDVDHILEIATHPELALEISNLRVLCVPHHNEKHGRYQKKPNKWENDEQW
ncbi:HNH endonuclease signature motif containing protein [Lysinibacillus xylanilyticus]|uniref:HNH endonuclease signature motif containing protein n=1 Tax=Lysinibacillus xylanilyticus TaxID=582475 RepID=UPI003CFDDD39